MSLLADGEAPSFRQARALPLRPDNFTPPTRTPWGGHRIVGRYKAGLGLGVDAGQVVGESWELSVGPEFPSSLETGELLADVLAGDPEPLLGDEAASGTRLLVKWLDADDDLSLQIHPPDDYPGLSPDEAGKPEAWYVVDREPGSGLYLGFEPGTSEADVRALAGAGDALRTRMRFVPVEPGDAFVVAPGLPHAVGRGVTLIEPQRVAPGRRGVTYRYWDWGRSYDATGRVSPTGEPRALHLHAALEVTDWARACDPALPRGLRHHAGAVEPAARASLEPIVGPEATCPLASPHLRMARLSGTGPARLPSWNVLSGITVIEGVVGIGEGDTAVSLLAGRTAAIPAALGGARLDLDGAHAVLCACVAGA